MKPYDCVLWCAVGYGAALGCSAAPSVDAPPVQDAAGEAPTCTKEEPGPTVESGTTVCTECECPGQPCYVREHGDQTETWGVCSAALNCSAFCPEP